MAFISFSLMKWKNTIPNPLVMHYYIESLVWKGSQPVDIGLVSLKQDFQP